MDKRPQPSDLSPLYQFKKLNLPHKTYATIERLGGNHHQKILEINRLEQEIIYKSLLEDSELEAYERQIASLEFEKIKITRAHFADIEVLLNDQQKQVFQEIKKELVTALFKSQKPPFRPLRPSRPIEH
jgi:hypothetical protein